MGLRSGDIVSGTAEERGGRRTVVALETVNEAPVREPCRSAASSSS